MLSIKKTDEKGVAAFVETSVPAGTTVLSEQPFEAVLSAESANRLSHWDFKSSDQLKQCLGCRFAR